MRAAASTVILSVLTIVLSFSCSYSSASDLADDARKLAEAKLRPCLIKCGDSSFMATEPLKGVNNPAGYIVFWELKNIKDILFLGETINLTDADRLNHWEYRGNFSLSYNGPVRFYDTREDRWRDWKLETITIPVTVEKQKGRAWSVVLQLSNALLKEITCNDVPGIVTHR